MTLELDSFVTAPAPPPEEPGPTLRRVQCRPRLLARRPRPCSSLRPIRRSPIRLRKRRRLSPSLRRRLRTRPLPAPTLRPSRQRPRRTSSGAATNLLRQKTRRQPSSHPRSRPARSLRRRPARPRRHRTMSRTSRPRRQKRRKRGGRFGRRAPPMATGADRPDRAPQAFPPGSSRSRGCCASRLLHRRSRKIDLASRRRLFGLGDPRRRRDQSHSPRPALLAAASRSQGKRIEFRRPHKIPR